MKKDHDERQHGDQNPLEKKRQKSNDMRQIIYERLEARRQKQSQTPKDKGESGFSSVRKNWNEISPNQRSKRPLVKEKQPKDAQTEKSPSSKRQNQENNHRVAEDPLIEIVEAESSKMKDKLSLIEEKLKKIRQNIEKKKEQQLEKVKKQKKTEKATEAPARRPSLKNLVTQVPEHQDYHAFSKNPYSPHHNIYYVSEIVRAYNDDRSLAREHLMTTIQIMAYFDRMAKPKDEEFQGIRLELDRRPGYQDKKTVVFDLDQTLIHCNENLNAPYDIKLPIIFPTGEVIEAGINIRPHAKEILKNLSKNFEVIVFTASHSCYANVVLDFLDPDNRYIHHRLFREHCYTTPEGMHVKDLRVLNRDLHNMVLVDNAAYSYIHQLDNGIPIIPYYHGKEDFELKALEKYLQSMVLAEDVREVNRKTFKLYKYHHYYHDLVELVEKLYLVEHNL